MDPAFEHRPLSRANVHMGKAENPPVVRDPADNLDFGFYAWDLGVGRVSVGWESARRFNWTKFQPELWNTDPIRANFDELTCFGLSMNRFTWTWPMSICSWAGPMSRCSCPLDNLRNPGRYSFEPAFLKSWTKHDFPKIRN